MNGSTALGSTTNCTEQAYVAALDTAYRRALHSCFNQHIITDYEHGFIAIDEGDYGALTQRLSDRVVHTVQGKLLDEF